MFSHFTSNSLLEKFYKDNLSEIENIKFTQREIDVLACLINGKGIKGTSNFLSNTERSISFKSVETHTSNIKQKISGNSKEDIINFITNSEKYKLIHDYFISMVIRKQFELKVQDIKTKFRKNVNVQIIIYQNQSNSFEDRIDYNLLPFFLKNDFQKFDVSVSTKIKSEADFNTENLNPGKFFIHCVQDNFLDFQKKELNKYEISSNNILVFLNYKNTYNQDLEIESIGSLIIHELNEHQYCSLFFKILQKIYPEINIAEILKNLEKHCKNLSTSNYIERKEKNIKKISNSFSDKFDIRSLKLIFLSMLVAFAIFLLTSSQKVSENYPKISFDLALPHNNVLLERNNIFLEINNIFNKRIDEIMIVALVGPGGIGKTTLARYYAYKDKSKTIWEINAKNLETLENSFENFAKTLAITPENKNKITLINEIKNKKERFERVISFVKSELQKRDNWLLIYDNVENFAYIQKFFPIDKKNWGSGKVLLTTKDSNIQNNKYITHCISVSELSSAEKHTLFTKIYNEEENKSNDRQDNIGTIDEFLEKLPPYPLDISIAAYYLKLTNTSFTKYLEDLTLESNDFEKIQTYILNETGDYTKTRYNIVTITLENLTKSNKEFADLLLFISLLDSNNISRSILDQYKDPTLVDEFIIKLKKHSLITKETETPFGKSISIHNSTQTIAQKFLIEKMRLIENKTSLDNLIDTFKKHVFIYAEQEDSPYLKTLLPHAKSLLKHIRFFSESSKYKLAISIGTIDCMLIEYNPAKILLSEAIKALREMKSDDYESLTQGLTYLGIVNVALGEYLDAKSLLEESLFLTKKYLKKDHPNIPKNLVYLGRIEMELGQNFKAKELILNALKIYKEENINQWKIASTERYLGNIHRELGDFKTARKILEKSLVTLKNDPTYNIHKLTWTYTLIGILYRDIGDYKSSLEALKTACSISETLLGEKEAWIYTQLANTQRKLGLYHESLASLKQSLRLDEKYFSKSKSNWIFAHFSNLYQDIGQIDKAINLQKKSLEFYKQVFGEDNIKTGWLLSNLGKSYLKKNDYLKAIELLKQSYLIHNNYYGDDHINSALVKSYIGITLGKLGKYNEGKEKLSESLNIYINNYGNEHIEVARILISFGDIYFLENNFEEAEKYYQNAEKIFQKYNHPDIFIAIESLGDVYVKQSQKSKSITCLQKALKIISTHYPDYKNSYDYIRINGKITKWSVDERSSFFLKKL